MALFTFWEVFWEVLLIFFVVMPIMLMWVFALTHLFLRRDIRWRKVIWLLVIVFFPVGGSLIYLLVRPDPPTTDPAMFRGYAPASPGEEPRAPVR